MPFASAPITLVTPPVCGREYTPFTGIKEISSFDLYIPLFTINCGVPLTEKALVKRDGFR
jgi:hypothetical protein